MTNDMDNIVKTMEGVVNQMHHWPFAFLLLVALTLTGVIIYSMSVNFETLSVKLAPGSIRDFFHIVSLFFRYVAPMSVTFLGALIDLAVGDYSQVTGGRRPEIVLSVFGFSIGCMAWVLSWIIYRKFRKMLPEISNGDTNHHDKER